MGPLIRLAAWLLVAGAFQPREELKAQERLFLSSLGLTGRPRPAGKHQLRNQVPPAFWKMFRRSETPQDPEGDPCTVSEYGVRGNIIRYVQDQGRWTLWPGNVICYKKLANKTQIRSLNATLFLMLATWWRTFQWAMTCKTEESCIKIQNLDSILANTISCTAKITSLKKEKKVKTNRKQNFTSNSI